MNRIIVIIGIFNIWWNYMCNVLTIEMKFRFQFYFTFWTYNSECIFMTRTGLLFINLSSMNWNDRKTSCVSLHQHKTFADVKNYKKVDNYLHGQFCIFPRRVFESPMKNFSLHCSLKFKLSVKKWTDMLLAKKIRLIGMSLEFLYCKQ